MECHKISNPLSMESINSLIKLTKTPIQKLNSPYKILSQILNTVIDIKMKEEYSNIARKNRISTLII